jgi:predicted nucleic acid-binding protein
MSQRPVATLTAVLDADATIGLSKGDVFEEIRPLYASLCVPSGVAEEVIVRGQGRAGAAELARALGSWIQEVVPDPQRVQQMPTGISPTDREVLALALDWKVDHVLTSDTGLRREASRLAIVTLQVPNLVVVLKDQGRIPAVKPVLDRMRQRGFGIDDATYKAALAAAGE